jgi:hypothetical protein
MRKVCCEQPLATVHYAKLLIDKHSFQNNNAHKVLSWKQNPYAKHYETIVCFTDSNVKFLRLQGCFRTTQRSEYCFHIIHDDSSLSAVSNHNFTFDVLIARSAKV